MPLHIQEQFVNLTEGYRFGDSDIYDTDQTEVGKLFKQCQSEYGRCIGKVYIDREGGPVAVGWVFHQRLKYEDSQDTYLREVWVTVHDGPPDVKTTYQYHELGA